MHQISAMQHLVISQLPATNDTPIDQRTYMLSIDMTKGQVRPRRLDFVIRHDDAMAIARLQRTGRIDTRFAMEITAEKIGFLAIERVRFDHQVLDGHPTYSIAQSRLAQFNL